MRATAKAQANPLHLATRSRIRGKSACALNLGESLLSPPPPLPLSPPLPPAAAAPPARARTSLEDVLEQIGAVVGAESDEAVVTQRACVGDYEEKGHAADAQQIKPPAASLGAHLRKAAGRQRERE
eukprot:5966420-Pleurochrysis_carterae.AAC.2